MTTTQVTIMTLGVLAIVAIAVLKDKPVSIETRFARIRFNNG